MYQIDNSTVTPSQPASSAPGTAGFFTDGNPASNIPATIVPAEWLNSMMMELVNTVTGAGQPLNKAAFNQLFTAIQSLIKNAGQGINSGAYINTTGKVNAVNAANLLFNGSGEFNASGWSGSGFQASVDSNGGQRMWLVNPAINNQTVILNSNPTPCGPNVNLTLSCELYAGAMTAGNIAADITCFDSGQNILSNIARVPALAPGQTWTFASNTGVTPANTAYIAPRFFTQNASSPLNGCGVRRMKCEIGTVPSLYSHEADQAAAGSFKSAYGVNVNLTLTPQQVGSVINCVGPAGNSYVLPLVSAIPFGSKITFHNTSAGNCGIFRQGSDNISINGSPLTSITMGPGDDLTMEVVGTGTWLARGSAALGSAGVFGAYLAQNGYQKFPGGLIVQWGWVGSVASLASPSPTLPISFTVGGMVGYAVSGSGVGSVLPLPFSTTALAKTTCTFQNQGSAASNMFWLALGY